MSKENRQHPRVKVNWPVTINTPQGPIAGVMKNVSAGGAFVCIRKSPKPDEEFLLSNSPVRSWMSRLSIGAKVTRQDVEKLDNETLSLNMGVRFTKLSGEARKRISEHVSTHLRREEDLKSETYLEQPISKESKVSEENSQSVRIEIMPILYPLMKLHGKQLREYEDDEWETDVSFPRELWINIARACDEVAYDMDAFSSPKVQKALGWMADKIITEIDTEDRRSQYRELYESFFDFVVQISQRTDLDRVRKAQLIHDKACQMQLQHQNERDLDLKTNIR
jgi:hypothetical protein